METKFILRPMVNWDFHVFSFLPEETVYGCKFKQCASILNDSWVVNLRESGAGKVIECKDPLMDYEWAGYRIASSLDGLRASQREYNKRMSSTGPTMFFRRYENLENNIMEKEMFNLDEIKFIDETAKRDLTAVNSKIENMVDELARLGKNLSEMRTVKRKLQGIVSSIETKEKENQNRFGSMSSMLRGCC